MNNIPDHETAGHTSQNRGQQITREWVITGQVQGVGFRPFIYRLANQFCVTGWVRNESGVVRIRATATFAILQQFTEAIITQAPAIAAPQISTEFNLSTEAFPQFQILSSQQQNKPDIHIPPDYFTCPDCVQELSDPFNHRYRYPFINCTQCGPRYTLIEALPYDRSQTSMRTFTFCPVCQQEYREPFDRRFHAEPVACAVCGPALLFTDQLGRDVIGNEQAISAALQALKDGAIVAVKGIGGYHLLCDACNEQTVGKLRQRKQRPDKPLAVMFRESGEDSLDQVRAYVVLNEVTAQQLKAVSRPIVLAQKQPRTLDSSHQPLAAGIAPGLGEVGVMLPYSPLHHLLLQGHPGPLVATSGNHSGEPVITDNAAARQQLNVVADSFLEHNRGIVRPVDDSVFRVIANTPRPLRLGRGHCPLELELPLTLCEPVLAVGGHMKNTVALAWDQRLVISPHLGTLDNPKALENFADTLADLQRLYQVEATHIICDSHPQYGSSRWARQYAQRKQLSFSTVQHHYAHAAACYGEFYPELATVERHKPCLIFSWDGVGYGEDQTLWGGESLLGKPGAWQRVGSFRPFFLPGGDKAATEPWRSAAALCWESGKLYCDKTSETLTLLHKAWQKKINCLQSSSAGRLFDAAAALLDVADCYSFEGQAPMYLEALAMTGQAEAIVLPLVQDSEGIWRSDWQPLLEYLLDSPASCANKAYCFHATLAKALIDQALLFRREYGVSVVGLSGGVFQNRLLSDRVINELNVQGFTVWLGEKIPVNDAGLSYGQVIEYGFAQRTNLQGQLS